MEFFNVCAEAGWWLPGVKCTRRRQGFSFALLSTRYELWLEKPVQSAPMYAPSLKDSRNALLKYYFDTTSVHIIQM